MTWQQCKERAAATCQAHGHCPPGRSSLSSPGLRCTKCAPRPSQHCLPNRPALPHLHPDSPGPTCSGSRRCAGPSSSGGTGGTTYRCRDHKCWTWEGLGGETNEQPEERGLVRRHWCMTCAAAWKGHAHMHTRHAFEAVAGWHTASATYAAQVHMCARLRKWSHPAAPEMAEQLVGPAGHSPLAGGGVVAIGEHLPAQQ